MKNKFIGLVAVLAVVPLFSSCKNGNAEETTTVITTTDEVTGSHVHSFTSELVNATCTERGYTLFTCSCGYSYKDYYKDALGHSLIHHNKTATYNHEGEIEYYNCTTCGKMFDVDMNEIEDPHVESLTSCTMILGLNDGEGYEVFYYDDLGNLLAEEDLGDSITLSRTIYTYDSQMNLSKIKYEEDNSGIITERETLYDNHYENDVLVSSDVTENDISYTITYEYQDDYLTKETKVMNDVSYFTSYTYYDSGLLKEKKSDDEVISYSYDEDGNLSEKIISDYVDGNLTSQKEERFTLKDSVYHETYLKEIIHDNEDTIMNTFIGEDDGTILYVKSKNGEALLNRTITREYSETLKISSLSYDEILDGISYKTNDEYVYDDERHLLKLHESVYKDSILYETISKEYTWESSGITKMVVTTKIYDENGTVTSQKREAFDADGNPITE